MAESRPQFLPWPRETSLEKMGPLVFPRGHSFGKETKSSARSKLREAGGRECWWLGWMRSQESPCSQASGWQLPVPVPAAAQTLGSASTATGRPGSFMRENPQLPGLLLGTLKGFTCPLPSPQESEALFPWNHIATQCPRDTGISNRQGQRQYGQRVKRRGSGVRWSTFSILILSGCVILVK